MSFTHGRGKGGEYQYYFCLGRQRRNGCRQRYVPIFEAEGAVERYYATVDQRAAALLPQMEEQLDRLLSDYDAEAEKERERLRKRIRRLEREQRKLLQLSYDDAIPDDLARDEQKRITSELSLARATFEHTEIKIGGLRERWTQLRDIASKAQAIYLAAPDDLRRTMNLFWFQRLFIKNTEIDNEEPSPLADLTMTERALVTARSTMLFTRPGPTHSGLYAAKLGWRPRIDGAVRVFHVVPQRNRRRSR